MEKENRLKQLTNRKDDYKANWEGKGIAKRKNLFYYLFSVIEISLRKIKSKQNFVKCACLLKNYKAGFDTFSASGLLTSQIGNSLQG